MNKINKINGRKDLGLVRTVDMVCYFKFLSTVAWNSRKQTAVATSTTEAEYVSLSTAAMEGIWIKNILIELGTKMPIFT